MEKYNYTSGNKTRTYWACTQYFTVLDHHTHFHDSSSKRAFTSGHPHDCFSLTEPIPLSTAQPSFLSVSFFNKKIKDTHDFSHLTTGHEPKDHDFDELRNSSVPSTSRSLSRTRTWMTWHSARCSQKRTEDKSITAIHVSVSQSSSVVFDGSGKLVGERNCRFSQLVLVSRETRTVLTASFLKTPKLRKWSMDQGKPDERDSSNGQIRTLLEEQRQTILVECHTRVSHHELQADSHKGQLRQQKLEFLWSSSTKFFRDGRNTKMSEFGLNQSAVEIPTLPVDQCPPTNT